MNYLFQYKCIGLSVFIVIGTNVVSYMLRRIFAFLTFSHYISHFRLQHYLIVCICLCKVCLFVSNLCTVNILEGIYLNIQSNIIFNTIKKYYYIKPETAGIYSIHIKIKRQNMSELYKTFYFGDQSTLGDLHHFIQIIFQSHNYIILHPRLYLR